MTYIKTLMYAYMNTVWKAGVLIYEILNIKLVSFFSFFKYREFENCVIYFDSYEINKDINLKYILGERAFIII